jgi:hypothetical protein
VANCKQEESSEERDRGRKEREREDLSDRLDEGSGPEPHEDHEDRLRMRAIINHQRTGGTTYGLLRTVTVLILLVARTRDRIFVRGDLCRGDEIRSVEQPDRRESNKSNGLDKTIERQANHCCNASSSLL